MTNPFESLFQHRRVEELSAQLRQRGELVDQLERQLLELRGNIVDLANKHREAQGLIQDLDAMLEEERAKQLALEDDLRAERAARDASQADQRRETSRALDALREAQAALAQKDEETRTEHRAREASEAELRREISRLLDSVGEAQTTLAQKDEEMRSALRARESSEAELRREISRLLDGLGEARAALAQKDDEARSEQSARAAAEAELRALIDSIATRGDTAHHAARDAVSELEKVKGALQAAQAEVAGERRARKDREAEVRALRENVEARKTASEELEAKLAEFTRQHGELTETLRVMSDQMRILSAELRERENDLTRAREEITHATARLAEVESSLRVEESAAKASREALIQTENTLTQERKAHAEAEQRLRAKIDSLIERRDEIKGFVQDANTELERTRSTLQLTERELAAQRDLRKTEVDAARAAARANEQGRLETKAMLREAHEALRAEREQMRALHSAFDREAAERARLAHELAHNPAQLRIAALEEQVHMHLARALDVTEPIAAAPELDSARRAIIDETKTGAVEAAPRRVIVIASEDALLRDAVASMIANLAGAALLPLPPANVSNYDAWLRRTLTAAHSPKIAVLPMTAEAIAALTAQTHAGRGFAFAGLLRRARVMHLVWSDKALAIARRQVFGAMSGADALDDGDARMSVPLYRDLIRRDQRLADGLARSNLFKSSEVTKLYVELADAQALIQFCRDGGFAIKAAKLNTAEPAVELDNATMTFAQRIRTAVEAQATPADVSAAALPALARAFERAGRYADAFATFEQAFAETPDDIGVRLTLANYLELAGRGAEAQTLLRDAAADTEAGKAATIALRDLFRRAGDHDNELAAAERMREAGSVRGALAVAAAAVSLERTEDARRAILEIGDTARSPALQRISTIIELQEALPALRNAADQGGAAEWFAYAEALRQLDKVDEAAQAYRRAENAAPGFLAQAGGAGIGPDLLLIGPPRTATTLLRRVLELHANVALLEGESSFLTNAEPVALQSFIDRVAAARARKPGALVGDKSPLHFTLDAAHVALAGLLFPQARIIVTTREPIERAFSEIKLFGHRRVTEASIAAALGSDASPGWLNDVIERSRYRTHLKTWASQFGADRVLLLQSEEFERNIAANCERLFNWLGLPAPDADDLARLQTHWSNRTAPYRLDPELEAMLRKALGDEPYTVRDLEAALKGRASRGAATPR